MNIKGHTSSIIWGIIIAGAIGYFIYSEISESKEEKVVKIQHKTSNLQIEQKINDLAMKHNAVIDWNNSFDKKNMILGSLFTIDVEKAIVRQDNRPILLIASVNDITKETEGYSVDFYDPIGGLVSPDIHYIIKCSPDQVEEIISRTSNTNSYINNFAVIANITEVRKVKFQLQVDSMMGQEDVDVELSPSKIFIAKGSCVDLVHIDGYLSMSFFKQIRNNNK